MVRKALCAIWLSVGLTLTIGATAAVAKDAHDFTPGAPGVGDPYFPLDGNGGYDVAPLRPRRRLRPGDRRADRRRDDHGAGDAGPVALQPRPRRARRSARSTSTGAPATWRRDGGELTVTPRRGPARAAAASRRSSRYDGVPETIVDRVGVSGLHPHRRRRARRRRSRTSPRPGSRSTTTRSTRRPTRSRSPCPTGLEAVANGVLVGTAHRATAGRRGPGTRASRWRSYLATATIGEFDLRRLPARTASVLGRASTPTCSTPSPRRAPASSSPSPRPPTRRTSG